MGFCVLHGWWAGGGFAELPWEGGREQEELGKPWIISYITAHIQDHSFVSGFAMLSCLFVVSGLAEGRFGSQNHCVGLLAEKLGREKLERMTQSRLNCRQWEQCISPFHIQNLTSLTSKSLLLYLLNGVKFHLLPEVCMGNWFMQGILHVGMANLCSRQGGLGGVCHLAWTAGLRHTLCICHCIMVLFIQGSNPPKSIIMHSLLSSQNIITSLWGWVMFTG